MKKKVLVILGVVLFLTSSLVFGYVFGGTNFGFLGYPSFSKSKPYNSYSCRSTVTESEFNDYRDEVKDYIDDVNIYMENCKYDIDRIIEIQKEVNDEAEQVIADFNRWADSITVTQNGYY